MARFLWQMLADEVGSLSEEKLVEFESYLVATKGDSQLFGDYLNVAGFGFLKLSIVGPFNIATNEGCTVTFRNENDKHEVESDTDEIYSDYSAALDYGITEFDLDLDNVLIQFIKSNTLTSFEINFGQETIRFDDIDQYVLGKLVDGETEDLIPTKLFKSKEELEKFLEDKIGDKELSSAQGEHREGRGARSARIWGAVLILVGIVLTIADSNNIYTGAIVIGSIMLLIGFVRSSYAEKLRNK